MQQQFQILLEAFTQNMVGLSAIPSTLIVAKYNFTTLTNSDYLLIIIGAFLGFLTGYLIGSFAIKILRPKLDAATVKIYDKAQVIGNTYGFLLLLFASLPFGSLLPIIAGLLKLSPRKAIILLLFASIISITKYLDF
jgi:membrane protein YqaA with SNARE-associated domain